jgi:DNA-binding Xre family transcriptional regulator
MLVGDNMTLQEQQELEQLINQYNSTDPTIIKQNIIKYIDASGLKNQFIADKMQLDIQTIYLYRQPKKKTNIDFIRALKLCNVLGISITDLIKGI